MLASKDRAKMNKRGFPLKMKQCAEINCNGRTVVSATNSRGVFSRERKEAKGLFWPGE